MTTPVSHILPFRRHEPLDCCLDAGQTVLGHSGPGDLLFIRRSQERTHRFLGNEHHHTTRRRCLLMRQETRARSVLSGPGRLAGTSDAERFPRLTGARGAEHGTPPLHFDWPLTGRIHASVVSSHSFLSKGTTCGAVKYNTLMISFP